MNVEEVYSEFLRVLNKFVKKVCKINFVTQYFSVYNSSVGERPAVRGETTRPVERQN